MRVEKQHCCSQFDVMYIIASDILIAAVPIAITVRRVEHPYLMLQHIRHGIVFEDTAPTGVGVF